MRVGFPNSGPTLYLVQGRDKPVLHRQNSTESNQFHHGETTYRIGWMSENLTLVLQSKKLCLRFDQLNLSRKSTSVRMSVRMSVSSGVGEGAEVC